MCELFALTSLIPIRVTFSLREFSQHGGKAGSNADGWGLAFYDGPDAQLYREPRPACSSEWMEFILHHPHRSRCVISHIRRSGKPIPSMRFAGSWVESVRCGRRVPPACITHKGPRQRIHGTVGARTGEYPL